MLNNLQKRKQQAGAGGFTIIEVLIVLAIAGLILLIVFLAVPALQRSSRNTQRKNDASAIGGAVANYISNNGGSIPKVLGNNASTSNLDVCATGGGPTGGASACTGNLETAKMGYYVAGNVSIANGSAGSVTPAPTTEQVIIEWGESCNDTNTGGGPASSRTEAIFIRIENGGTGTIQCIEQ